MSEISAILFRSTITFMSLLVFSRILGKTQISQMTFFEYVAGITIGSIAGVLTTDLSIHPWPTYVGLTVWVVLTLTLQTVSLKSRWMGKLLDGQPVVVIQNGQILEENMRSMRMRVSELNSMLRAQGIFDNSAVEFAVMEPRGELSVLKRSQERPVTPADLQIPTTYEGLGIELVVDGEVMDENLRRLHVNRSWLQERLQEHGVTSPKEAFLAVLDTAGRLYVDRYTDRIPETDQPGDYPGPN